MMYCPKCGISLPDDATECDACGAKFDPMPASPKAEKKTTRSTEVKSAFRKWAQDQGMFCLIAKAVAVIVMLFYLLTSIVYTVTLIVEKYSGGVIFSEFFLKLLTGLVYGVIIWLLSDAVLYLQKLYEMKKNEMKDK
jgi:uncharacterized membrane protein YagU involved in acid resistance